MADKLVSSFKKNISYDSTKKAFTLLELIIVLTILAIMASMAVARFVDMANKALDPQEKATISSLRVAVLLYYGKYGRWYADGSVAGEEPFDLLENAPPHVVSAMPGPNEWYLGNLACDDPCQVWIIQCPHYDDIVEKRGNEWVYIIIRDPLSHYQKDLSPGTIFHRWRMGH